MGSLNNTPLDLKREKPPMFRTKLSGVAKALLAAALIAVPATMMAAAPPAYADCGDTGKPPCTGPVPTLDEVVAVMNELTDPNIPAMDKGNVVTPGFTPDEAATIDEHLKQMNTMHGGLLPLPFIVTDIQPAPDNLAGATLATAGGFHQVSAAKPIVLVDQGGHWLITHDTAMTALNAFWYNANRRRAFVPGNSI